jgi:hypothetical protein
MGPDTGGGWLNGRGDENMTMFIGYGHIVDFFTSIAWWKLNPDNSLFAEVARKSVQENVTHVVYTRNKAGRATMYLDGQEQAGKTVTGDCSNWDVTYRLALANELTQDRPWRGELYRVAIYDHALEEKHVAARFKAGYSRTLGRPIVLYDFRSGQGDTIIDVSDAGKPLNLKVSNTEAVAWLSSGGLVIKSPVLIGSTEPAAKITSAVRTSREITLEAWIKPANTTQTGPARIVTISKNPSQRNCTLGQKGDAYEMRFRTSSTSPNGEPALSTPGGKGSPTRLLGLRSTSNDLAVIYTPVGGTVAITDGSLVNDLKAKWYNPRNGQWTPATTTAKNTFTTPDENDWVLLFRKDH